MILMTWLLSCLLMFLSTSEGYTSWAIDPTHPTIPPQHTITHLLWWNRHSTEVILLPKLLSCLLMFHSSTTHHHSPAVMETDTALRWYCCQNCWAVSWCSSPPLRGIHLDIPPRPSGQLTPPHTQLSLHNTPSLTCCDGNWHSTEVILLP